MVLQSSRKRFQIKIRWGAEVVSGCSGVGRDKAASKLPGALPCLDTYGSVFECGLNLSVSESMRKNSVATIKAVVDKTNDADDRLQGHRRNNTVHGCR